MSDSSAQQASSWRPLFLDLATGLMVLCAIGMTGTVMVGHFTGVGPRGGAPSENRKLSDWTELSNSGNRMGPSNARVVIVTFPAVIFEGTLLAPPPDSTTLITLIQEHLQSRGGL